MKLAHSLNLNLPLSTYLANILKKRCNLKNQIKMNSLIKLSSFILAGVLASLLVFMVRRIKSFLHSLFHLIVSCLTFSLARTPPPGIENPCSQCFWEVARIWWCQTSPKTRGTCPSSWTKCTTRSLISSNSLRCQEWTLWENSRNSPWCHKPGMTRKCLGDDF